MLKKKKNNLVLFIVLVLFFICGHLINLYNQKKSVSNHPSLKKLQQTQYKSKVLDKRIFYEFDLNYQLSANFDPYFQEQWPVLQEHLRNHKILLEIKKKKELFENHHMSLKIKGRWWQTAITEENHQTIYAYQFEVDAIDLLINKQHSPELVSLIKSQINDIFFVEKKSPDIVLNILMPFKKEAEVTGIIKKILALGQISTLAQEKKYLKEEDVHGNYLHEYVGHGIDQNVAKIEKKKILILPKTTRREQDFGPEIDLFPNSLVKLEFDLAHHQLNSIDALDKEDVSINDTPIGNITYQLKAKKIKEDKLTEDFKENLIQKVQVYSNSFPLIPIVGGHGQLQLNHLVHLFDLGGWSTSTLFQLLEVAYDDDINDLVEFLYLKIEALFSLRPDTIFLATTVLDRWDPKSPASNILISALAHSGHLAAQNYFSKKLLEFDRNWPLVEQIILALPKIEYPNVDLLFALKTLMVKAKTSHIKELAGESLGHLLVPVLKTDPLLAKKIIEELKSDFENTYRVDEKAFYLSVLGNTGDESVFQMLVFALDSDKELIVQEAIWAIRNYYFEGAHKFLMDYYKKEKSLFTKCLLVDVMGLFGPGETTAMFYSEEIKKVDSLPLDLRRLIFKNLINEVNLSEDFKEEVQEKYLQSSFQLDATTLSNLSLSLEEESDRDYLAPNPLKTRCNHLNLSL